MARPFHEVLAEVDYGTLSTMVSEKLAEVVRNVIEVEKPGQLTLTLTIKPNGDEKVIVDGKVVSKVPEKPVDQSFFFARPDGSLTRNSPKQEEAAATPAIAAIRAAG
jgi:hypothetical protein